MKPASLKPELLSKQNFAGVLNTAMDEIVRTFSGRCPYKLLCLNNNVGGNEVALLSAFERLFPEKSRYEA